MNCSSMSSFILGKKENYQRNERPHRQDSSWSMWEYGKDQFQNAFTQLLFSRALLQNFLLAFSLCILTCISYRCHIDHVVTSLSNWESIFVVCDAYHFSFLIVTFGWYVFGLSYIDIYSFIYAFVYIYMYLPLYMHLYEHNNTETRTWFIFLGHSHTIIEMKSFHFIFCSSWRHKSILQLKLSIIIMCQLSMQKLMSNGNSNKM